MDDRGSLPPPCQLEDQYGECEVSPKPASENVHCTFFVILHRFHKVKVVGKSVGSNSRLLGVLQAAYHALTARGRAWDHKPVDRIDVNSVVKCSA